MDIRSLDTKGYVQCAYPRTLHKAACDAMTSWKKFCTLSLETKRLLSGGDRIRDFGYMRREDVSRTADEKELFHAVRSNFPTLLPKAKQVNDARATEFITSIEILINEMSPLIQDFARSVQSRYGLHGFEREVMHAKDFWTFRFLRYPKQKHILAHAHADRGGFTFHLGESEGGGECLGFDRVWRPWPLSGDETIIFPSMGLQYRSHNQLKALCHRVLPVNTSAEDRYSMVAFIDFQQAVRFNDQKYRMQDFDPGFNYDMPFEEFKRLFEPRKEMVPG